MLLQMVSYDVHKTLVHDCGPDVQHDFGNLQTHKHIWTTMEHVNSKLIIYCLKHNKIPPITAPATTHVRCESNQK
jgi:hypothetical protein